MTHATTVSTMTASPTTTMPTTEQQTHLSTTTLPTIEQQSPSPQETYENRLQAALEHARRLTQMYGAQGADVSIAWEAVEELRTAGRARFSSPMSSCQSSFEQYCAENPYALEARSYDC